MTTITTLREIDDTAPEWPYRRLQRLEHVGSRNGINGSPPERLWLRGEPDLIDAVSRSVAIVGSRASTTYGSHMAADLAGALAEKGQTIITGGAFGIDVAAARGALAAGGIVVVVLACGADVAYPSAHAGLFDAVLEKGGLIVSEQEPGTPPTRARFLARNRIIAALANGTVVVEAAVRSGALNTAGWTMDLAKPLMGVPGPITSAASEGVHQLIRLGQARLVTESAHVMEEVAP